MKLHNLSRMRGVNKPAKRVGRGIGSGKGGHTTGLGQKGQKSRGSREVKIWFEGGQLPLSKRLPQKGGFVSHMKKEYTILNLKDFSKLKSGSKVDMGFIKESLGRDIAKNGVKILGEGDLKNKINFEGFSYSKSAKGKIEKAGGSAK